MNTLYAPLIAVAIPAAVLSASLASPAPLAAQVTIPAQSASSRDGTEEPESVPTPLPNTGATMQRNSPVGRIPPPPPADTPTAPVPAAPRNPGDPVAAMQRVPEVVQNIDVARMERLSELRRELRIADSAHLAKIALRIDDFFLRSKPEQIDELVVPTLRQILEFIELNPKQVVTLRSFHSPTEEDGEELARKRSDALLAWFRENTTLDAEHFRSQAPEPLRKPSPKAFAATRNDTEYVSRIEFWLEEQ